MSAMKWCPLWRWPIDRYFLRYRLDDIGKTAEIKDKAMLKRFVDIKALDSEDKNALVYVLDSLLRDAKARKVYASQ